MEPLEATPPDITFETKATLHLASRSVEILFLGRAHTRGDVVAYLPDVGVAFAGDIAFHKYIPNARDGFPADWIMAASRLGDLRADIIVPGHGPLGSNAELQEMRECLELVVGQVRQSFARGLTEEQAHTALQLGPFANWGRQEDRLPGVVRRAYMELRGDI
jgi:cyclase